MFIRPCDQQGADGEAHDGAQADAGGNRRDAFVPRDPFAHTLQRRRRTRHGRPSLQYAIEIGGKLPSRCIALVAAPGHPLHDDRFEIDGDRWTMLGRPISAISFHQRTSTFI